MRARESVVSMFDPLQQSSSPPSSPESDKENKGSFLIPLRRETVLVPQLRLMKRLVDVGDETILVEDPENIHPSIPDAQNHNSSDVAAASRAPFGELSIPLEVATSPLQNKKTLTHPPFAPSSLSRSFTTARSPARRDKLDEAASSSPTKDYGEMFAESLGAGRTLPSDSDFSPERISASPDHPFSPLAMSNARLRVPEVTGYTDSSISPSHTSFHLRVSSGESSFDLLNDKISFLDENGHTSFSMPEQRTCLYRQ